MKKAPKGEKTCSVSKGLVLFYSYWIIDDWHCGNNALLSLVPKILATFKDSLLTISAFSLHSPQGGEGGSIR